MFKEFLLPLGLIAGLALPATAAPQPGKPAPLFDARNTQGKAIRLEDLRGSWVMLEWTNHDCPYVQKHYNSGNMQALQRDLTEQGVVWLSVISSKPGKQGHVSADQADALTSSRDATPTHVLLDETSEVGMAYNARTTPEMVLIDQQGVVRYMGAIDDKPSTRPETVDTATNYVRAAWADIQAGQPVRTAITKPYGCSVKY